jgi:hypothetical protein
MTAFERTLTIHIGEEMERLKNNLVAGGLDIRTYDRNVAGYHALRLVLEEFIPAAHKSLNDSPP